VGAEFNWWLLIVGVVVGGVLTWLVMADSDRRDSEVDEDELPAEAAWIARSLARPSLDAMTAEEVLRAHRRYLGFAPPDALVDPAELDTSAAPGEAAVPGDAASDGGGDVPARGREQGHRPA
jgi:hypothetical protein